MGNDILGIFDPHEKYGFSGERGTEMANFDKRYEWLLNSEIPEYCAPQAGHQAARPQISITGTRQGTEAKTEAAGGVYHTPGSMGGVTEIEGDR